MCGIFGYNFKEGAITAGRRAILGNNLARLNDKRGGHSWGVCNIEDGATSISRGLGDLADHAFHLADGKFVMAHTRYATIGAKTVENAHPFEIGNIIGAHNGGCINNYELDKKYKRDCKVDSMHFFHHLDADIPFLDIKGYGSLEWLRKDELDKGLERVFLSRMKGGMLAIFGIGDPAAPKSDGIVWSSDEKHLLEALFTAGIEEFYPYKVEEGAIFYVQDGEVYIDHQKKCEIGEEAHRKGAVNTWEGHGTSYGVQTRHQSNYKGGGNSTTTTTKSDTVSSQDRDLTDWREWNLYCEEREGDDSETGTTCETGACD
jgi:hypothetical protein